MQAEVVNGQTAQAWWTVKPWAAWLLWTLTTAVVSLLCLPVAEALGLPVVWGFYVRTAGGLIEGALTGAIIGFAQWLVMRLYMPKPAWWLWTLASALGLVLGIIVLQQSRPFVQLNLVDIRLGFASDGVIIGVVAGLCQWLAFWPHLARTIVWWPATILGLAPFFLTRAGLTLEISKSLANQLEPPGPLAVGNWISVTTALLIFGATTGLAFAFLVRKAKREVAPM